MPGKSICAKAPAVALSRAYAYNTRTIILVMEDCKNKPLTPRQEAFCNKYLETGNASEAYRYAYTTDRMKPETINNSGYKLLQKGEIKARLAYLRENLAEAAGISALKVVRELERIAFADATAIRTDWGNLKSFEELTAEEKSIIKDIDVKVRCTTTASGNDIVETTTRISMHDKLKAIETLSQMLGYNKPIKVEADVKSENKTTLSLGNMKPEDIAYFVAEIQEKDNK